MYIKSFILRNFYFLVLFSLFIYSCQSNSQKENTDDKKFSEVILKFKNFTLTKYDLQTQLEAYKNKYKNFYKTSPPKDSLRNFVTKFTDNLYLLNQAFEENYQNDSIINKRVELNTKNKTLMEYKNNINNEKKIELTDRQIKEAYEYLTHIYHTEYLKFNKKQEITPEKFETFFAQSTLGVEKGEKILSWPFDGFFDNMQDIAKLKENEVSSTISSNGFFYIFKIKKIELRRGVASFESVKNKLAQFLRSRNKNEDMEQKTKKILLESNFRINEKNLSSLIQKIDTTEQVGKIDSIQLIPFLNYSLAYYTNNDITHTLLVSDYFEFYKRWPKSKSEFIKLVENIVISESIYYKISKELNQDPKFQADKKGNKYSLMLNKYIEQNILNTIFIDDEQSQVYYKNNISHYKDGVFAEISLLSFDNHSLASRCRELLMKNPKNFDALLSMDNDLIKKAQEIRKHFKIRYDEKGFEKRHLKNIFSIRDSSITSLKTIDEKKIMIVYKYKETGNRILSYAEVKDNIQEILKSAEFYKRKKALILTLKEKTKPVIIRKIDDYIQ